MLIVTIINTCCQLLLQQVGTRTVMDLVVGELVHKWPRVEKHLLGLCFDTTASKTGKHTGTYRLYGSFSVADFYF
jgi:hypothetical protein